MTEFWVCNAEGVRVALRWCMQIWVALWKSVEAPWNIAKESMCTFSSYPNWLKGCTHYPFNWLWCPRIFWVRFFFLLAVPWGIWDLSSLTSGWTCVPAVEMQSPNHWTAQEVPGVRCVNRSWLTVLSLCPRLSPSLDFDHFEWEIPSWYILPYPSTGLCTQQGLYKCLLTWVELILSFWHAGVLTKTSPWEVAFMIS